MLQLWYIWVDCRRSVSRGCTAADCTYLYQYNIPHCRNTLHWTASRRLPVWDQAFSSSCSEWLRWQEKSVLARRKKEKKMKVLVEMRSRSWVCHVYYVTVIVDTILCKFYRYSDSAQMFKSARQLFFFSFSAVNIKWRSDTYRIGWCRINWCRIGLFSML